MVRVSSLERSQDMRFGIKCKVDSHTEIGKGPIQVSAGGMDFTLAASEDGLLRELTVIVGIDGIDKEDNFTSQTVPSTEPGKGQWEVTINVDQRIYSALLEMVQYLEASLSFLLGVHKIYWDEAETVFIPENEEDRRKYNVTSFSLKRKYPEASRRLSIDEFKAIIQRKSDLEPFTIIKLFHRDGVAEFGAFRYIQAFYNFYFVLEGLYG